MTTKQELLEVLELVLTDIDDIRNDLDTAMNYTDIISISKIDQKLCEIITSHNLREIIAEWG